MVFPWFSYGFPMVFLWFTIKYPISSQDVGEHHETLRGAGEVFRAPQRRRENMTSPRNGLGDPQRKGGAE